MFVDIYLINCYNFRNFGGFRMPMTAKQKARLLNKFFPLVNFAPVKSDYFLGKTNEIFNKYIGFSRAERPYINISEMAKNRLFKPILPESKDIQKYRTSINRIVHTGDHDVIRIFIKIYDELFAKELNKSLTKIKIKSGIISADTLTKKFLDKKTGISCGFSTVTNKKGELEDKFIWDFPHFGFYHKVDSIYDAFYLYAQNYCNLYLFGAECNKYKTSAKKINILNKKQTLIEYFGKDKDRVNNINVGDFVWRRPRIKSGTKWIIFKWNEIENKEHLLERFRLDRKLKVSLKEIYHGFCIPLMNLKKYPKNLNDRYYEIGHDLIKETLLDRKPHLFSKININRTAWAETVYYYLEDSPDGDYRPVSLERYIEQVAGQVDFLEEKEEKAAAKGGDYYNEEKREWLAGGRISDYQYMLYHTNNVFRNVRKSIPKEIEEEMYKAYLDNKAYDLVNLLHLWISRPENRTKFPDYYEKINEFYLKINTITIQYKNEDEDEDSETMDIEDKKTLGYEAETIRKEELSEEDNFIQEREPILRDFLVYCFSREFDGNLAWINEIRRMDIVNLYQGLKKYSPKNKGTHNNDSFLYVKYKEITGETAIDHTQFTTRIRNIIVDMKNNHYWEEK